MIDIRLSEFVEFVSKAGTPKVTVVKEVKKRHLEKYDPCKDFYKQFRDGIVDMHRNHLPKESLSSVLHGLTDERKRASYVDLVEGYSKFLGRKPCTWFNPPKCKWEHADVSVVVNPELGLEIEGVRHVVKMYLTDDDGGRKKRYKKLYLDIATHLMRDVLATSTEEAVSFDVLDVRKSKLIVERSIHPDFPIFLKAEAVCFAQIYNSL